MKNFLKRSLWWMIIGGIGFAAFYFSGDAIQCFMHYELDVSDAVSTPVSLILGAWIGGMLIEAAIFAKNWIMKAINVVNTLMK